jgi:hypothetical protein
MTPAQIIKTHAVNQGQNVDGLAAQVQNFLDQPKTSVIKEKDCLFLVKAAEGIAYFYILNGGNQMGYVRALKEFKNIMRTLGYHKIAMRVEDQETSKRIAMASGAKSVKYKHVGGAGDPYLMTMEI